MRRVLNVLAAGCAAVVLSACGGGGGDGGPCGGPGNLSVALAYRVNGVDVNPLLISLRTGVPVNAVPVALGLPAACQAAARWTFRSTGAPPAGLSFDSATGAVTGTPTAFGFLTVEMTLRVDGYTFSVNERAQFGVSAGS